MRHRGRYKRGKLIRDQTASGIMNQRQEHTFAWRFFGIRDFGYGKSKKKILPHSLCTHGLGAASKAGRPFARESLFYLQPPEQPPQWGWRQATGSKWHAAQTLAVSRVFESLMLVDCTLGSRWRLSRGRCRESCQRLLRPAHRGRLWDKLWYVHGKVKKASSHH